MQLSLYLYSFYKKDLILVFNTDKSMHRFKKYIDYNNIIKENCNYNKYIIYFRIPILIKNLCNFVV